MQQSKLTSMVEVILNTASGFILAFVVWQVVAGLYDIDMPFGRNFQITTIFTIVSVLRSYVWRRIFNKEAFALWMEIQLDKLGVK